MRKGWITLAPPVPPSIYLRRPQHTKPFPLGDERCRVFHRARHGLWYALKALGLGDGDEALVPAYHHGSEIEALVSARLTTRFYECDEGLEPREAELESLLTPNVRLLYLIHYLGFTQDMDRWRTWCDARGLLLFEDAAQSWLSRSKGRPVGSAGDAACFCLYKTLGLSSGAAAVCSAPFPMIETRSRRGLADLGRAHAAWFGQRFELRRRGTGERRLVAGQAPDSFELGDPYGGASRAAAFVVDRVDPEQVVTRRRRNYSQLLASLGDYAPTPFNELVEGVSPLHFPLEVASPLEVVNRLAAAGVEGGPIWPKAHNRVADGVFPQAERRRRTTVALPVHHQLDEIAIKHVTAAAKQALARTYGRAKPRR